jgi:hypothetical protein
MHTIATLPPNKSKTSSGKDAEDREIPMQGDAQFGLVYYLACLI